jgi:hypothetical protein
MSLDKLQAYIALVRPVAVDSHSNHAQSIIFALFWVTLFHFVFGVCFVLSGQAQLRTDDDSIFRADSHSLLCDAATR